MKVEGRVRRIVSIVSVGLPALVSPACSKMSSPTESMSPQPAVAAATITLTSAGVSTHSVTVPPGSKVVFVNSDSAPHEIASDPDPMDTQCPELNGPVLAQGASFTPTMAAMAESCGFHDQLNPMYAAFQGSIFVSAGMMSKGGATVH